MEKKNFKNPLVTGNRIIPEKKYLERIPGCIPGIRQCHPAVPSPVSLRVTGKHPCSQSSQSSHWWAELMLPLVQKKAEEWEYSTSKPWKEEQGNESCSTHRTTWGMPGLYLKLGKGSGRVDWNWKRDLGTWI